MSLVKSLEDYSDEDIQMEFNRRRWCYDNEICNYCDHPYLSTPCRFVDRHSGNINIWQDK